MDAETIKAIADAIANQTILTSWKTWSVQFSLWIVGTFGAAYAAAYLAKRGEHKAIKADFDDLKNQLKENTTAVKTIETEIGHADWAAREWKTMRIGQIEELISEFQKLTQWLGRETYNAIENKPTAGPVPSIQRASKIITLYLPEFRDEYRKISEDFDKIITTMTKIRKDHNLYAESPDPAPNWERHKTTVEKLHLQIEATAIKIDNKAAKLLRQIVGVEFTYEPTTDSSPPAKQPR